MTEVGMFVYPWDIGVVDAFRRDYPATGCDAVAPALSYHSGNVLSARSGRTYRLDRAALSFAPDPALYGDLKPAVHKRVADEGVVTALRDWCADSGRAFCGWTVLLHNSTIGAARPDVCVENSAGDRHHHALCPSHPEVERYCLALMEDICSSVKPDSVIVESATNRTAVHGRHHEIANVRIGQAALWLLSLCFCPHCLEKAGRRPGLDPEKARAAARDLTLALLNQETHIPGGDAGQALTLLVEYPELHAYQLERQKRVGELLEKIAAVVKAHGVAFKLIPSATPFEATASYLEGFSYATSGGIADVLVPLVYGAGETLHLVKNNIRLFGAAGVEVGMALTLHPGRYPSKADFLAAVAEARADAPECAYLYNYSLASAERLAWIGEAAAILHGDG